MSGNYDISLEGGSNVANEITPFNATLADENYLIVGNHVDECTHNKIENGEFVDFARLLPRDRVEFEEDNRMEIVNRNGKTYFVPASDVDSSGGITNFSKWEQAFRVFSDIYTRKYPLRSTELIQYNHTIHTAALTYSWEKVYLYDRDFRHHIAAFPLRSWAVILQQAWTMRLKDRNSRNSSGSSGDNHNSANNQSRTSGEGRSRYRRDHCWRYNAGNCTFGSSCKFDHRCAICNKYGHGAHNCCRANCFSNDHHGRRDEGHDRND